MLYADGSNIAKQIRITGLPKQLDKRDRERERERERERADNKNPWQHQVAQLYHRTLHWPQVPNNPLIDTKNKTFLRIFAISILEKLLNFYNTFQSFKSNQQLSLASSS